MRKALWKKSKALVKAFNVPLGEPWDAPAKPKKRRTQVDEDAAEEEVEAQDEAQMVEEDWGVVDKDAPGKGDDDEPFFDDDDDEGEL
jgi:hypothetical protein